MFTSTDSLDLFFSLLWLPGRFLFAASPLRGINRSKLSNDWHEGPANEDEVKPVNPDKLANPVRDDPLHPGPVRDSVACWSTFSSFSPSFSFSSLFSFETFFETIFLGTFFSLSCLRRLLEPSLASGWNYCEDISKSVQNWSKNGLCDVSI